MKAFLPIGAIFAFLLLFSTLNTSCKKTDTSALVPKEDLVLGKWNVNRIQLKIFSNGVFIKDTIIPQKPKPQNFVNFDANGSFEYRYNSPVSDIGNYQFVGADSVIADATTKNFRWKMLTLTKDLFTVVMTSTSDAYYPGYYVENYQTFVRYK